MRLHNRNGVGGGGEGARGDLLAIAFSEELMESSCRSDASFDRDGAI